MPWRRLVAFLCRPCTCQWRTTNEQMPSPAAKAPQWDGPSNGSISGTYAGNGKHRRSTSSPRKLRPDFPSFSPEEFGQRRADIFTERRNRGKFIYLLTPPFIIIPLYVLHHLRFSRDNTDRLPAQSWFAELHRRCPSPLPPEPQAFEWMRLGRFFSTLALHAWYFSTTPIFL